MLTTEQVESAKKDRSHLAIVTLDSFGDSYWPSIIEKTRPEDNQKRQEIYRQAFIPFSEKLHETDFSLGPLDIISIWSRAKEIFPEQIYARYELSTSLACSYGSNPIDSQDWKRVSASGSISERLHDLSKTDKAKASLFSKRLTEIDSSLKEIDLYRKGTTEDIIELARKAYVEKDEEAKEKLLAIQEKEKETDSDGFLHDIHENWGNGMYWMFVVLVRN